MRTRTGGATQAREAGCCWVGCWTGQDRLGQGKFAVHRQMRQSEKKGAGLGREMQRACQRVFARPPAQRQQCWRVDRKIVSKGDVTAAAGSVVPRLQSSPWLPKVSTTGPTVSSQDMTRSTLRKRNDVQARNGYPLSQTSEITPLHSFGEVKSMVDGPDGQDQRRTAEG
ncbi:hypothetical protein BCV70DRAFT_22887 [Testicularia cyperi]|uniref:Uncharacterized protein n=1 Tax=Testicularia cyperi TaxID=1882483 RepID=A0A317Y119_9BASI|nr:hypothetical protein BCV70DRAFT_22887 [Testicularia cyperi]